MSRKSNKPIPGFAFCNAIQSKATTTYMREHGSKIQELFSMNQTEDCIAWQTEVLEELIGENQEGFFVTDLSELTNLTINLNKQLDIGKEQFVPFIQQIITLSQVPFRKISNGDDRRCFHHVGEFFGSFCPFLKMPYPDLQLEASKALHWFARNCGPLNTSEESTFRKFFPPTDALALYSFVPTQLRADQVVERFSTTVIEILDDLSKTPVSSDVLTLCLKSLFEFVKRGLSSMIPPGFVNSILSLMINHSEFKISISVPQEKSDNPICSTRVLAHSLLFFSSFIQEYKPAMELCLTQTFISTIWNFFVEFLFSSFKNVQKRIRNDILAQIVLILQKADFSQLEKNSVNKIFDLSQSISLLIPDTAVTVSYSTKTRKLRLTHERVDIEIIFLAQDLALVLHQKTSLPPARLEYIEHQIEVLQGKLNKYLLEFKDELTIHALQLLHCFVHDIDHFVKCEGTAILMKLIIDPPDDDALFFTLLLSLRLFSVFKDPIFVKALMSIPRDNLPILSIILSLLATLMQNDELIVNTFMEEDGLELLKLCFTSQSPEVVVASVDCARSIAPYVFPDINQRLVFQLLDCADNAPALLRYTFVGLFLDLYKFQPFVDASQLWKSLKTNSNVQRAIVKWWREEEERLDIHYDKCIIIDIDKPLHGHPLAGRKLKKIIIDQPWLLDKNTLEPRVIPYKLDFRSRLYLLLSVFPPLLAADCKPTDRIKELLIRQYLELKKGSVWMDLKEQLKDEEIKPLHDDKGRIEKKLEKMRSKSLQIQEEQCEIWQQCENDRIALEQRTYNQLADGLRTAQYVAENYKAIVNSQPVAISRPYQGRTVKGEDILVSASNLRTQQKQEIMSRSPDENNDEAIQHEKEMEESYINDCLHDESISYLVQLMKNTETASKPPTPEQPQQTEVTDSNDQTAAPNEQQATAE